MNFKRALVTGAMLWVIMFVAISILMSLPSLAGKKIAQFGIFWVFLIPLVFSLCKWHFKMDPPSTKKGFLLGIVLLSVAVLSDALITVPLFVKSYSVFFGDWMVYAGYVEILVLCIYAGFEFDKTFTKREEFNK